MNGLRQICDSVMISKNDKFSKFNLRSIASSAVAGVEYKTKNTSASVKGDNKTLPAKRNRIHRDSIITYEIKDNELNDLIKYSKSLSNSKFEISVSVFISTLVSLILCGTSNKWVEYILVGSFVSSVIFFIYDKSSKRELKTLETKIKNRK